jgi:hypothetical protein
VENTSNIQPSRGSDTLLDAREIKGQVGEEGGIPTFLLVNEIARLWAQKEIEDYPSA